MASRITISSQNINGFARNESYIKGLCEKFPNSIRGFQEHWLKPPYKKHAGVNKLRHVHDSFDGWGTSAMRHQMEKEVRLGRPFGGTGFLWNKSLSMAIKPRIEYKHERVSVLELNGTNEKILIVNAYMPYYNPSQIDEQVTLYTDTLGFIDSVMEMNRDCNFIFMSDLNCNINDDNHPFSVLIRDFMLKRNLISSYDLINNFDCNTSWTRKGKGRNGVEHFSLIDFILISRSISSKVENVRISDYPENLSDHCPVELDLIFEFETFSQEKITSLNSIDWKKIHGSVRSNYEAVMERELDSLTIPDIVHGKHICDNISHLHILETYYQNIVNAIAVADSVLPRCNPSNQKHFWNDELSKLKNESIDAFSLWKNSGRPRSGVIFDLKKSAQYRYKCFLRRCQKDLNREKNDELHNNLIGKDPIKFWKSWKSIHGSGRDNAIRIDGFVKDDDIANRFADSFRSVYQSNDPTRVSELSNQFDDLYSDYCDEHKHDDISCYYLSWNDMLDLVDRMKVGKAAAGFVKYEHILLGSPKLLVHLHLLFNGLIQHGYVPQDFLSGVVTPIVKDAEGDVSSSNNYRGITLSVVFASLFEMAILTKIGHMLTTDHLQFGYKKRHSCSHAVFVMRSCIDYFIEHGSNVFATFLDCSKGFDKIDHSGLFIKLIKRGIPLCFLNIIIYWYRNLTSVVKWNNSISRSFHVKSGVRQGGILSPRLFILYVNDLLIALRASGAGCYIEEMFVAAIMYADDLALLAPTRKSMQQLLNICQEFGIDWCLTYNPTKTSVLIFGKSISHEPLYLNNMPIATVNSYKYLGVNLAAGKRFDTPVRKPLMSFYCSTNTILNVLNKPSETVLMKLLYSNCVPVLTYGCEVKRHSGRDMTSLDVALNDCIRKIFGYNRWESTRELRRSLGYESITEIFAKRNSRFLNCLGRTGNSILIRLKSLFFSQ